MNIAIFGGTFNPPTNSHKEIIEETLVLDFVDQLWIMPSGKREDKEIAVEDMHRINMLNLFCSDFETDKHIKIIDYEINSNKITRTIETVKYINRSFPNYSFWYVFGMDSYLNMRNWRGGNDLINNLKLIIAPRDGKTVEINDSLISLHLKDNNPTSSTEVRNLISKDLDVSNLVCNGVLEYIHSNNLYR